MVKSELKLSVALLIGLWLPMAWAIPAETLNYRVYYQGWLSAMQQLNISEARLMTEWVQGGEVKISTLSLSSAAHGMVDAVYPIRYRLRSVYDLRAQRLMAMERYKRTRRFKHDLAWVDAPAGRLYYARAAVVGAPAKVPVTLQPWVTPVTFTAAAETPLATPVHLLDRLSLLQALRHRIPAPNEMLTLAVIDGSKFYRYEITAIGTETVTIAGRQWASWRLSVVGYEQRPGEPPSHEPEHAPIDLWISQDQQRLPLRFRAEHAVGSFAVEWVPSGEPITVALDAPLAAPEEGWSDGG